LPLSIGASDDYFEPGTVKVQPGTTVKWVNNGKHKHTVTSNDGRWDSGDLAPGATYSVTFTRPGTFSYFCRHHKGMKGTIVVGSGGYPGSTG
jgi:plastocyanin